MPFNVVPHSITNVKQSYRDGVCNLLLSSCCNSYFILCFDRMVFDMCFVDLSDLQKFVEVALATAAGGEGDLANDRLSNLRTVGSGFSSLIYTLDPNTGLKALRKKLLSIWKTLESDTNLPQKLVCLITNTKLYIVYDRKANAQKQYLHIMVFTIYYNIIVKTIMCKYCFCYT